MTAPDIKIRQNLQKALRNCYVLSPLAWKFRVKPNEILMLGDSITSLFSDFVQNKLGKTGTGHKQWLFNCVLRLRRCNKHLFSV